MRIMRFLAALGMTAHFKERRGRSGDSEKRIYKNKMSFESPLLPL